MNNPLLSPAENAALAALRSNHTSVLDSTVSTHPTDNGLIPFFNVTWARFLSALIVAFNGGAYVGGNLVPVSYELVQGVHTGLPFIFNGLGLVVCGAVAHALHDTPRAVLFTAAQTLMASWI
jgi:hypothetical protein